MNRVSGSGGEQRSCIEMSWLMGELKEWVVCRHLSV